MEDKSTNQLRLEEQPQVVESVQQERIEGNEEALPEKDVQEGEKEEDVVEDGNVEDDEAEEDLDVEKDLQANQDEEEQEEYEEDNNEQYDAQPQGQKQQEAAEQVQPQAESNPQQDLPPHQGPTSTIHETLITPTPTCNCCNHSAGSEIFCQQTFDPQPLESEYEQQSQSQIQHVYSQQQPAQEWRDDELVIRKDGYGFLEQEYDFVVGQTEEEMIDQAEKEKEVEEKVEEIVEEKENLEMAVQVEIVEPVVEHEVKEVATQSAKPITMKSAPPTSNIPKGQEARFVEEPKQETVVKIEETKQEEQPPKEVIRPVDPQPAESNIEQKESTNVIKTEVKEQPKKSVVIPEQKPAEKPKMKKKVKKETKDPKDSKPVQTKNVQIKKVAEVAPINPPPKTTQITQITQPKVEEPKPQVKPVPKEEIKPIASIPPVKPEEQKPEQKKYEVTVVEKNAFKSTKKNEEPIVQDEQPIKNEEVPHQGPNNALLLRNRIHQAELQKKEKQEPPTAEELIDPKKDEPKVEAEQPKHKVEREQPHSKMGPAKKKKKKKIVPSQAPKNNEQPNKKPASQVNSRRSSKLNSEIDPSDKASVIHQSRDPSEPGHPSQRNLVNMISPELIAAQAQAKMPILTSLIVVKQAEKQRVGTTYKMFLKYNYQYQRTVNNYRRIVDDVCSEISKKKESKRPLQRILQDYFQDFCKQCREYNQRCYKIEIQDQVINSTNNKFANIRLEMKKGFDQMVYLRKSIANNSHRLNGYVTSTVLNNIRKAFEVYHSLISQEENKQRQRREEYYRRAKMFNKVLDQVDKNFNKGLQGKVKDDLFVEITRFINEEKVHRVALRTFGRGLIDLRNTFIKCQKELFDSLQDIINKFKTESKAIYCFGPRIFDVLQDYSQEIKTSTRFLELCTLTDLDYIKYVLQIQSKKETNEFSNRNFESYLDLVFFDRVVGNIRDTLKGATNKVFPMENPSEELIHSISGNLVLFSREHDLCKDKYQIKNLNAKIIGAGFVQFDELIKGLIFDDNRTIRLKLKDEDRVQQLICYLNQKEEDILLDHGRRV